MSRDRRGRQIAQRGVGLGGKYRNIRLIYGSCQAGPGRDRSLFLDSLLADQSMEQSHKPPGGTGHSCPLPHTPAISSVAYTRGAAGSWSSASRLVFACSIHTTPQVGADGKPAEAPHRRAHGDDYPLELRSSLTNRHMKTIDDATGWIFTEGLTQVRGGDPCPLLSGFWAAT